MLSLTNSLKRASLHTSQCCFATFPSKPRNSAYTHFTKEEFPKAKQNFPEGTRAPDVMKELAVRWKTMSGLKKAKYERKVDLEKTAYEKEVKKFPLKELEGIEDKKERKKCMKVLESFDRLPKKPPRSAYQLFVSQQPYTSVSGVEHVKKCAMLYGGISNDEKFDLQNQVLIAKEKYEKEMEKKMR